MNSAPAFMLGFGKGDRRFYPAQWSRVGLGNCCDGTVGVVRPCLPTAHSELEADLLRCGADLVIGTAVLAQHESQD
jgi:hypothetical protein